MSDGAGGFRIKTMKLRGVLSQGLLLPKSMFPELGNTSTDANLDELLKVVKYEKPIPAQLRGKIRCLYI